jgi:hypothetical protein
MTAEFAGRRFAQRGYCHLKFPTIREDTLGWNRPVLNGPGSGSIVDFYGPCDYDPLGKNEISIQRELQRQITSHHSACSVIS